MLLADSGQHLPNNLVVDHHMILSYLLFMLCLGLLCFDQISIRRKK